jgi:hypothetical protein
MVDTLLNQTVVLGFLPTFMPLVPPVGICDADRPGQRVLLLYDHTEFGDWRFPAPESGW